MNVAANMLGKLWLAGLQIIFAPLYLYFLGPTSYGLLGFYTSLLLSLVFLDHAFSAILSRELARLSSISDGASQSKNLLFTLEVASSILAICLGSAIWLAAPYIATHWISDNFFAEERLVFLVRLMGLSIACQWLTFLYNAGYLGLQRQDVATRLRIILATIQWAGAAAVLWFFGPELELFFFWQIFALSVSSIVMRTGLRNLMPHSLSVKFSTLESLKPTLPFAFGSLAIGLTGSLISQADKLLVAKFASLDQLAGYSLCFLVASLLTALVSHPVCVGLIPHFTRLIASHQEKRLIDEYHLWTQGVAVISFPITAALVFFPQALAFVWLPADGQVNELVTTLIPWAAAGTLFNVLSTFLYVLQTAYGMTRILLIKNVVTLVVSLPVLIYFMPKYGPIVGTYCWLAANLCYYLFEAPIVHSKLLKGELKAWWLRDTLFPGVLVGLVFSVFHYFAKDVEGWSLVGLTAFITLASMVMLIFTLPGPRKKIVATLLKKNE